MKVKNTENSTLDLFIMFEKEGSTQNYATKSCPAEIPRKKKTNIIAINFDDATNPTDEHASFVKDGKSASSKSCGESSGLDGSLMNHGQEESTALLSPKKPRTNHKTQNHISTCDEVEKESKLAEQLATALKNELCYDEIGGDWYTQFNGLWRIISEKKALKLIMRVLEFHMPDGYTINKLNSIKSFLMIYLLLDTWESRRYLLPMTNGVLDTRSMKLIDYSHEHRFNWQLPYPFNPDAEPTIIECWLRDACGEDLESINIIRAFFKMALVGGVVQKFLELIGSGGTGKSTLIRLLVAFIGEKNHAATDLKNLESNRFEPAALYGKRLALINDSSRYGGEVSILKKLTGGDPVRFEKKNKQQSDSFVFEGIVVIASNEAIQTADYTSGLIRRRMPVYFNRKVTDADKLKWSAAGGIETAMLQELPGLLNWVMSMTEAEVNAVIGGINGQMSQAQQDHLVETNKIANWLDDNIIVSPNAVTYVGSSMKTKNDILEVNRARREKLYPNYESWCDDNAVHPIALNQFTASVIDVCEQMRLAVTSLNKDARGKPIRGIAIREAHHRNFKTPITRKLLNDASVPTNDPSMTHQVIDNEHDDALYSENLSVNKSLVHEDVEVF